MAAETELHAARGMLEMLQTSGHRESSKAQALQNLLISHEGVAQATERRFARSVVSTGKENQTVVDGTLKAQLFTKAHDLGRLRAHCEQRQCLDRQLLQELMTGREEHAKCCAEVLTLRNHEENQLQNVHELEAAALRTTAEDVERRSCLNHMSVEELRRKKLFSSLSSQCEEQAHMLADAHRQFCLRQKESEDIRSASVELLGAAEALSKQQEEIMRLKHEEHRTKCQLLEIAVLDKPCVELRKSCTDLREHKVEGPPVLKQEELVPLEITQANATSTGTSSDTTKLMTQLESITIEIGQQRLAQSILRREVDQRQQLICEMRESERLETNEIHLLEKRHSQQKSEHCTAISKAKIHVAGLKDHIDPGNKFSDLDKSVHSPGLDSAAIRACQKEVGSTMQSAIRRLGVEKIIARCHGQDDVQLLSTLALTAAQEIRCEVKALLPHVLAVLNHSGRLAYSFNDHGHSDPTVRMLLSEMWSAAMIPVRAASCAGIAPQNAEGTTKSQFSPSASDLKSSPGSVGGTPLSQYSAFTGPDRTERSANSIRIASLMQVCAPMGHEPLGELQSPVSVSSINATSPSTAVECNCRRCDNASRSRISESSLELSPSRLDFKGASGLDSSGSFQQQIPCLR